MIINKEHDVWASAPWHVKVSCLGIKTDQGLSQMAFGCFLLSNLAIVVGFIFLFSNQLNNALISFSLISCACAAYLYSVAQVWLLKNNEVLSVEA